MDLHTPYAFGKSVSAPFSLVDSKIRTELQKEGFGILSEIDVTAKFKEKLDKDFRKYLILGACNPTLAWQAFGQELNIGVLLPCNVVLYETDQGEAAAPETAVMIMDPEAVLSLINNPLVADLAAMVKAKMERVLAAI
ncbi:MAG: hypothetical protein C0614_00140 [Desulfuromonas sp.]|nr:MAG: hypothetical protein C0614_00140 [Desulfuromonas sp.]